GAESYQLEPQGDHIPLSEGSVLEAAAPVLSPERRWWLDKYLVLEFIRKPQDEQVAAARRPVVAFGDLRRVTPIARRFGYERGQPIDRHYIEAFLEKNASAIHGHVLEVGDGLYTRRFGGSRVAKSDVLHVTAGNPAATIVGDLSRAEHIPSDWFDCIICTQTL